DDAIDAVFGKAGSRFRRGQASTLAGGKPGESLSRAHGRECIALRHGGSVSSAALHGLVPSAGKQMPLRVLLLLDLGRVVLLPDRVEIDLADRNLEVHVVQRVGDDLRDDQVAKPLPVGGYDIPWRVLAAGQPERILKRFGVALPQFALGVV